MTVSPSKTKRRKRKPIGALTLDQLLRLFERSTPSKRKQREIKK